LTGRDAFFAFLTARLASVGVATGLNLPVLGRLLGHTQMQTTQGYAHVDIDPALVAANAIGAALSEMMNRAASEP
jgi:integrase